MLYYRFVAWVERSLMRKLKGAAVWVSCTLVVVVVVLVFVEQRRSDQENSIWGSLEDLQIASLTIPTPAPNSIVGCYMVEPGDTIADISAEFLGDDDYYGWVMFTNDRDPMTGSSLIRPGDQLLIKGAILNTERLTPPPCRQ
ncbi:MAG: hypothetical protein A2172_03360 [Candidatus Woykebacteria bacterium RBG_13_40_15]|uniref:LysM domain-containing protein n=1 Tax=Candidatus Woykebacteria bacterium RBG_13_40_15 TaxID=1802593 RepID=A0A1G1W5K1_9BACT|nr:MAG: hypothetical protein A2172_03360 [Candidatus Woykebacteria bacterium RBG_13_40_15]